MNHGNSRSLTILMVLLLMLSAFVIGFQVGGGSRNVWASMFTGGLLGGGIDTATTLRPVELFQDALGKVQREYVEPVRNTDELTYSAIRGMLASLNDPYTRFMDPKEFADFNSDTRGSFAGIGATLDWAEIPATTLSDGEGSLPPIACPVCATVITNVKHYRVRIVEPLPNSPAKAAGLQRDDFIMKVDQMSTDGKTVEEVAEKIRGPEGTKVTLTIARKGATEPLVVTITRAKIEVPATETKMLDGNIGYLRLFKFNEKTFAETQTALREFEKAGVKGIVLDLRNNPGGLLSECIRIASLFVPDEHKIIVFTRGRNGTQENLPRVGRAMYDKPLVVLVNKGSASASEILAGALKDYKRAVIVGESTFGKALVQSVLRMSGGAAMAITTAHYYTPSGVDVGKKGVMPDNTVELAKETKELSEQDNQAQAAVAILKEAMRAARK